MTQQKTVPAPVKRSDSPLAATLLGATLLADGQKHNDLSATKAGEQLIKAAMDNQSKMPKLPQDSKMATAIRKAKKAMAPLKP